MKKIYFVAAVCGVLLVAACAVLIQPKSQAAQTFSVNGHVIKLEIARTPVELALGLGDRAFLDQDAGMLFVMPLRARHTFWMKDMRFPLDIIWLDEDKIVDMVTLQAPTSSDFVPIYTPQLPANRVLELNAGEAQKLGLQSGTQLQLPE